MALQWKNFPINLHWNYNILSKLVCKIRCIFVDNKKITRKFWLLGVQTKHFLLLQQQIDGGHSSQIQQGYVFCWGRFWFNNHKHNNIIFTYIIHKLELVLAFVLLVLYITYIYIYIYILYMYYIYIYYIHIYIYIIYIFLI